MLLIRSGDEGSVRGLGVSMFLYGERGKEKETESPQKTYYGDPSTLQPQDRGWPEERSVDFVSPLFPR